MSGNNGESIEIIMLKQQIKLLREEIQQLKQFDHIQKLWNSVMNKVENLLSPQCQFNYPNDSFSLVNQTIKPQKHDQSTQATDNSQYIQLQKQIQQFENLTIQIQKDNQDHCQNISKNTLFNASLKYNNQGNQQIIIDHERYQQKIRQLEQEVEELKLRNNQIATILEEKEAKIKLLSIMNNSKQQMTRKMDIFY